jgi:hypothetical protein
MVVMGSFYGEWIDVGATLRRDLRAYPKIKMAGVLFKDKLLVQQKFSSEYKAPPTFSN